MRKLVLCGQSVDEYKAMFDLSDENLHSKVLEYGCGATPVNATLRHQTALMVSCDPLFALPKATLMTEVTRRFEHRAAELSTDLMRLNVSAYGSFDAWIKLRKAGCDTFFTDYEQGLLQKRYISEEASALSFNDFTFDFALCSHYLFTDIADSVSAQEVETHLETIKALARVANEVRIFPVINNRGEASTLLGPVLLGLQQADYGVEVREVPYTLYPKGNVMLRVWAKRCSI